LGVKILPLNCCCCCWPAAAKIDSRAKIK